MLKARTFGLGTALVLAACGSPPQGATPAPLAAPKPVAAENKEPPVDTSPVPDPPNLVVVGRVSKPDAIVNAVGIWTRLPLPSGPDLLRSITDDAVADTVDLSQPVDLAVTVALSRRGVDPLIAFAVNVKSFDQAKAKLGESHRLVPGANGSFKVSGLAKKKSAAGGRRRPPPPPPPPGRPGSGRDNDDGDDDGDDDDDKTCVLAHAMNNGARLVCGEGGALESLVPYLTRTIPREKWSSDIHLEVRPEPVRAPLQELRTQLPVLARGLMGSQSPAIREFIDASLGEVMDIVNDAQKLSFDAQVGDPGINVTTRFEFQSNKSVFARMMTMADKADAPPPAFWHLPQETDTAFFGRGSDPKLFEHPRELVANLLMEATDSAGMPEAERKAVKDLVADRMLALFTNGSGIYAKGYDQAAVEKASKALHDIKWEETKKRSDAKTVLGEQMIGWHLYQVSEPVAKVGPILKDWSALWNRPAFAKWAKDKAGAGSTLPRMKIVPPPAGVTLPKDTVHLEITIPRDDLEEMPAMRPMGAGPPPPPPPPPPPKMAPPGGRMSNDNRPPSPPPKLPPTKKVPQKPIVFHVFAVPDGGATWLAFGLDAKLTATKAAASLSSAPDTNTLGKAQGTELLREGKINGGGLMTMRGLLVFTAMDSHERDPFALLPTLPNKGTVPVIFTGRAEGPSDKAKAGSTVGQLRVTRAFIEDVVKLVMTAR